MIFGPPNDAPQLVRAQVDFLGLVKPQHQALVQILSEASGLAESQIILCYSHTHPAGHYAPERFDRPGGELIADFLADVNAKMRGACAEALTNVQDAVISYATGRCNMAVERDYWDVERGIYVCGYNPDAPADDTVQVARITDKAGALLATVVNYGCHPISLAWENTLIQQELRRRFPNIALLFTSIAGEMQVAYLPPQDRYGKGLYQEEPSILAAGCLETLTETITAQIQALH